MSTPTLSDRSLKQGEICLIPFLICDERLLSMHCTVADELGFDPPAALADVLAAGLGPEPRPAFNNGTFYFANWQVSLFYDWLTERASNEDLRDIASIMRRHDPALDELDEDEDVRGYVFAALCEGRGHNDYSTRYQLFLGC